MVICFHFGFVASTVVLIPLAYPRPVQSTLPPQSAGEYQVGLLIAASRTSNPKLRLPLDLRTSNNWGKTKRQSDGENNSGKITV